MVRLRSTKDKLNERSKTSERTMWPPAVSGVLLAARLFKFTCEGDAACARGVDPFKVIRAAELDDAEGTTASVLPPVLAIAPSNRLQKEKSPTRMMC